MSFRHTEKTIASPRGHKVLEVIVTSPEEAVEAERGGADRLEVVRSLEEGGLTPEINIVAEILKTVSIPVRVMLRERNAMSIACEEELQCLQRSAGAFASLPIDGLVLGFVTGSVIDTNSLGRVLSAAPESHATFHRAFEVVDSPAASIELLKQVRQVDRILVRLNGTSGTPQISHLVQWQRLAAPEIKMIVGLGLDRNNISRIRNEEELSEVHAGRLLREPETAWGCLSRNKLIDLKSALG